MSVLASKTVEALAIKTDVLSLNPQDPHGEKEEQTSHVVLWPLHVHPGAHACVHTRAHKLIVKQMMHYFIYHHLQFFSPLLALGHAAFITTIETLRHQPKKLSCPQWPLVSNRNEPRTPCHRKALPPSRMHAGQWCWQYQGALKGHRHACFSSQPSCLPWSSPHWRPSVLYTSSLADI